MFQAEGIAWVHLWVDDLREVTAAARGEQSHSKQRASPGVCRPLMTRQLTNTEFKYAHYMIVKISDL
jgi:hypothetical protein